MNTELINLIKLLESATGPSHELNERIFSVVYGWGYPLIGAAWWEWVELGRPEFTGSVDAALKLLSHTNRRLLSLGPEENTDGGYTGRYEAYVPESGWVTAATSAIAICVAALKVLSKES